MGGPICFAASSRDTRAVSAFRSHVPDVNGSPWPSLFPGGPHDVSGPLERVDRSVVSVRSVPQASPIKKSSWKSTAAFSGCVPTQKKRPKSFVTGLTQRSSSVTARRPWLSRSQPGPAATGSPSRNSGAPPASGRKPDISDPHAACTGIGISDHAVMDGPGAVPEIINEIKGAADYFGFDNAGQVVSRFSQVPARTCRAARNPSREFLKPGLDL